MEFIKFMWRSFTIGQKIALVLLAGVLGVCVYGVTQHPIWWLALASNILVLWVIVYAEWCLYKIKKWMNGGGDEHDI